MNRTRVFKVRLRRIARANIWTLRVFALFCASIVVFAALYDLVYRVDETSFVFNSDVLIAQRELWRREATTRYEHAAKQISALDALIVWMEHNRASKTLTSFKELNDYYYIHIRIGGNIYTIHEVEHWPVQFLVHGGPTTYIAINRDSYVGESIGIFTVRRPTWQMHAVEDHLESVKDVRVALASKTLNINQQLALAQTPAGVELSRLSVF